MTRRKLRKMLRVLTQTRVNRDFFKYISNKSKSLRLRMRKSTEVAFPSTVMLELGNLCNIHCITCPREYAYGKAMDKGFMPIENAKAIVDEIYPYLDSIGLTGLGETLLYPQLKEIASYIKSKKQSIVISLSTNANVPRFMEHIKELLPVVDTIQVSTDGLGEVYEAIRVNARFDALKKNLTEMTPLAKQSKCDIVLNMVITQKNYRQMSDLIKFASEMGMQYLNFNYFNLASVTDIDTSYYKFYYGTEFQSALKDAIEESKHHPALEVTGLELPGNSGFDKCPFPWSHFYVTWDGWVVPCCAKPFPKELNFGNVFEDGLMSCLNSDKFKQFRVMWQKNKNPRFCDKCNFIDL